MSDVVWHHKFGRGTVSGPASLGQVPVLFDGYSAAIYCNPDNLADSEEDAEARRPLRRLGLTADQVRDLVSGYPSES